MKIGAYLFITEAFQFSILNGSLVGNAVIQANYYHNKDTGKIEVETEVSDVVDVKYHDIPQTWDDYRRVRSFLKEQGIEVDELINKDVQPKLNNVTKRTISRILKSKEIMSFLK